MRAVAAALPEEAFERGRLAAEALGRLEVQVDALAALQRPSPAWLAAHPEAWWRDPAS